MRLLTLTAAALLLAAPLTRADDRKPPPDADAQAKSEALIKNLFKEDFAKRKPADLQALASKLMQQAAEAKDATGQFVMLRLAAEAAAKGGDVADALQAVDAQAKDFAVNALALKAQALDASLRATGGATIDYQAVVDAAFPAAEEAQAADDFDTEARLLRAAQVAATKSDRKPLATVAAERIKLVDAMQKEYDNVKGDLATLQSKPDDPDASLHAGRFLCFFKGDWDKGLPLLAVGADAKLRDLAKKDLNGPTGAADQAALADAWTDAADAETGVRAQQIQLHAQAWYKQAAPQLAGLDKAKAEKRIKDIDKIADKLTVPELKEAPPEPGWVVLFRSFDPSIWDPPMDVKVGENGYAIPLSKAPDGVQFLKLKLVGTNRYVVIPMTNDGLKKKVEDGVVGWNGENNLAYKGYHLGIYTLPLQGDFPKGNIVIHFKTFVGSALGWGFGHRIHRDDVQGFSWEGVPIAATAFEISVKAGPLTEKEAKVLLGKK